MDGVQRRLGYPLAVGCALVCWGWEASLSLSRVVRLVVGGCDDAAEMSWSSCGKAHARGTYLD